MSIRWCLRFLFLTLSSLNIVLTVPPDYCLLPLNRDDCNMAPKTVYSYYKAGSRCEIETWRGCPTANKFDNEFLCSLNCIFRQRLPVVENVKKVIIPDHNEDEDPPLDKIYNLLNLIVEEDIIKEEVTITTEQEAVTESTTEAVTESTTEAVIESTTEAETESTTEAVTESTTEAETETTTEAVTESITEAVIESTTEAVTESTTEAETTTDSETESTTEAETEATTEAVPVPETDTDDIVQETITALRMS